MKFSFHPKLLDTLPGYGKGQLSHDVSAGLTVGVLALPLAMAFAIASGMSPTAGIWTAIVAGFIISALGGSRVQIGGPTGAFIPIIYAIVVDYGVQNLLVATMLAGAMLVAMGVFRIGNLIRFIPKTVVIGFTNGIAVVIFLAQIKDFLGLQIEHMPGEFFGKVKALVTHLDTLDIPTVALSVASLVVLLSWNRLARRYPAVGRLPGPLGVLVLATAANAILQLPVETIGSRFNGIPVKRFMLASFIVSGAIAGLGGGAELLGGLLRGGGLAFLLGLLECRVLGGVLAALCSECLQLLPLVNLAVAGLPARAQRGQSGARALGRQVLGQGILRLLQCVLGLLLGLGRGSHLRFLCGELGVQAVDMFFFLASVVLQRGQLLLSGRVLCQLLAPAAQLRAQLGVRSMGVEVVLYLLLLVLQCRQGRLRLLRLLLRQSVGMVVQGVLAGLRLVHLCL